MIVGLKVGFVETKLLLEDVSSFSSSGGTRLTFFLFRLLVGKAGNKEERQEWLYDVFMSFWGLMKEGVNDVDGGIRKQDGVGTHRFA